MPGRHNFRIVNVSSVELYSPFRYPGGKAWLIPSIQKWLAYLGPKPHLFVEPFAGGANVSLFVAANDLASRIAMTESHPGVASVWNCILNTETGGRWLANRIRDFEFTDAAVRREISQQGLGSRSLAFQTILRNRVNRGGILASGAGQIRRGENGSGLSSRWYPETLHGRITAIVTFRHRIAFMPGDGLDLLIAKARNTHTVYFIDPPYTAGRKSAGERLYDETWFDHEELFEIVDELDGPFLMTNADCAPVRQLANEYGFEVETVRMKNTHHRKMNELLISRDLSWLRGDTIQ